MIGWRYVRHWHNNGSPNFDNTGVRSHLTIGAAQPDSLAPEVTPTLDRVVPIKVTKSDPLGAEGSSTEDRQSDKGESAPSTLLAKSAMTPTCTPSPQIEPMSPAADSISSTFIDAAVSLSPAGSNPTTPQHSQIDGKPLTINEPAVASHSMLSPPDHNAATVNPSLLTFAVAAPSLTDKCANNPPQESTLDSPHPTTRNIANAPISEISASLSPKPSGDSPLLPQARRSLSTILPSSGGSSAKLLELMKSAAEMGLTLMDFNGDTVEWTQKEGKGDIAMPEVMSNMEPQGQERPDLPDTKGELKMAIK